jgi:hypothetical protein
MKLNPKIAWGLAWAGLAVVVAVPSVDFLTGRGATDSAAVLAPAAPQAAATAQTPASSPTVTTTRTATGVTITPAGGTPPADPVDAYVNSGKAMPDYISDGPTAAQAPAAATVAPPAAPAAPTQVAALDPAPAVTAPTPFPRPLFPAAPKAAPVAAEPVVIVDETTVTGALGVPAGPTPPAPIVDDSTNWETESLRQYLERRGILEGDSTGTRSSARVTERNTYDPDGFYLNDGPNNARLERQRRLYELFEDNGAGEDFTLF